MKSAFPPQELQSLSKSLKATVLIGASVKNMDNEDLGAIQDIMINIHSGRIEYIILEYGSFLGIGGKLFAIPLNELKPVADTETYIINRSKEYLKEAPGFDSAHWPKTNDRNYYNDVNTYYGVMPPFP